MFIDRFACTRTQIYARTYTHTTHRFAVRVLTTAPSTKGPGERQKNKNLTRKPFWSRSHHYDKFNPYIHKFTPKSLIHLVYTVRV